MNKKSIAYNVATWRRNPSELIHRAIYSDKPEVFGKQKHRADEAFLFYARLAMRPLTMLCLRTAYKNTGYTPIGYGYNTIALLKGSDVLKVYEFTTKCTNSQMTALVKSIQKRLDIAQEHLEGFYTPTRVAIINHPIVGTPCVVLRQEYVRGKHLSKKPYSKYLTNAQKKNFIVLLKNAEKLYSKTGYLLDVNGHNLMAHNDTVKIVDTVLMGSVDANMRPMTMRRLKKELQYLTASL